MTVSNTRGTGLIFALVIFGTSFVCLMLYLGTQAVTSADVSKYQINAEVRKVEIAATATHAADAREERTMYAIKDAYREGREDGQGDGNETIGLVIGALIASLVVAAWAFRRSLKGGF